MKEQGPPIQLIQRKLIGAIRCNCYGWLGLDTNLVEKWKNIFKQNGAGLYKIMRASDFYDCDIF